MSGLLPLDISHPIIGLHKREWLFYSIAGFYAPPKGPPQGEMRGNKGGRGAGEGQEEDPPAFQLYDGDCYVFLNFCGSER